MSACTLTPAVVLVDLHSHEQIIDQLTKITVQRVEE